MKKNILITGTDSYVGTNVEKWLLKEPDKYHIETLDMKDPNWRKFDFSKFDVVFHVAGIAHVSNKKTMEELYYKVNRDLTIETAKKAKQSGVHQFIFMSSMIVYSSKETKITSETKPNPDNFYGRSKLEAENGIKVLQDVNFKIVILRPPMIYGAKSKGNYEKLRKLALTIKVFPNYSNKRSMLYINNLASFVKYIIDENNTGLFLPQNPSYSSTSFIVKNVANYHKKLLVTTRIFNPFISLFKKKISVFNKMFSDYFYETKDYVLPNFVSLENSIKEIESIKSNHE